MPERRSPCLASERAEESAKKEDPAQLATVGFVNRITGTWWRSLSECF